MTMFTTSTPEMQQASNHVFAVNDTVQSELSGLRGKLGPLAGGWQGRAAVTFTQLMARWDESAGRLNSALRAIGDSIQVSGRSYEAQEQENAGSMSRISAVL
ncbi:MAG TPA: WXG100 family type VII secretion target [Pseudonocardia sp.]|jgi:WXG100 family type VII secretion target|nr:WXG100 family type VII secretion target [Pseudonocardia sp.]